MGMKQSGTDYGTKGESGEKEPSGAKASDSSGERKGRIVNGTYVGHSDRPAGGKEMGEMNTGRSESVVYNHKRIPHDQD